MAIPFLSFLVLESTFLCHKAFITVFYAARLWFEGEDFAFLLLPTAEVVVVVAVPYRLPTVPS